MFLFPWFDLWIAEDDDDARVVKDLVVALAAYAVLAMAQLIMGLFYWIRWIVHTDFDVCGPRELFRFRFCSEMTNNGINGDLNFMKPE